MMAPRMRARSGRELWSTDTEKSCTKRSWRVNISAFVSGDQIGPGTGQTSYHSLK